MVGDKQADAARAGAVAEAAAAGPEVTILMGVYNGAADLAEQLDSLARQSHPRWRLIASDDGSTDGSGDVIAGFARTQPEGRVTLCKGPGQGFARNYLSMIRALPEHPGWVAFSDQDDIWLPDRLSRGIARLSALPGAGAAGPALFCTRTWIFDKSPDRRHLSRPRPRPPAFRNAVVQNIAAGNTTLLNPAAAHVLRMAAQATTEIIAHDWWAYQLISGAEGGCVIHEDEPTLLYRQHGGNLFGSNQGVASAIGRLGGLLGGQLRRWIGTNLAALEVARPWLSQDSARVLDGLRALHEARSPLVRLAAFRRLGLYRQTRVSTLAIRIAAALGRL